MANVIYDTVSSSLRQCNVDDGALCGILPYVDREDTH